MTPFWQRVYTTIIQRLTLSIETNWEDYTDEDIMSIPFHLPAILRDNRIDEMAKLIRPKFYRLRIYLLRDILCFSANKQPPLEPRLTEPGKTLINQRIRRILAPDEIQKAGQTVKDKPLCRETMKAFASLRKLWPNLLTEFPTEFMERLNRLQEPNRESAIAGILHTGKYFDITSIHELVPWNKLTLAGITCREYTIKQARRNASDAHLIILNWKPEEVQMPTET